MSGKKKKFNSRFPPARIKKMMQSDEDVGKVAWVVPCLISKALEIFSEQLMSTISDEIQSRNARTLSTAHIKAAIMLKDEFITVRELAEGQTNGDSSEFGENDGGQSPMKRKSSADEPPVEMNTFPIIHNLPEEPPKKRGRGRPRKQAKEVNPLAIGLHSLSKQTTQVQNLSKKSGRSTDEFYDDEEEDEEDEEDDDEDDDEDYR